MKLTSVLDLRAAKPLWAEVSAARGQALEVDASEVERLGGLIEVAVTVGSELVNKALEIALGRSRAARRKNLADIFQRSADFIDAHRMSPWPTDRAHRILW